MESRRRRIIDKNLKLEVQGDVVLTILPLTIHAFNSRRDHLHMLHAVEIIKGPQIIQLRSTREGSQGATEKKQPLRTEVSNNLDIQNFRFLWTPLKTDGVELGPLSPSNEVLCESLSLKLVWYEGETLSTLFGMKSRACYASTLRISKAVVYHNGKDIMAAGVSCVGRAFSGRRCPSHYRTAISASH